MYVRALIRINSTDEIDNNYWSTYTPPSVPPSFFSWRKSTTVVLFLIQLEVQVKTPIHIRHPLIGKDDTHKHTPILMIAHSRL
jgi:hypothetical protein